MRFRTYFTSTYSYKYNFITHTCVGIYNDHEEEKNCFFFISYPFRGSSWTHFNEALMY